MKIHRPFNACIWLMGSLFGLSFILCPARLNAEEATEVSVLSSAAETTWKGKIQNALARLETLGKAVEAKIEDGKPSVESLSVRSPVPTGGGRAMASKVVGTAGNKYTGITSKLTQTRVLYKAAADAKTDKEARMYFDQAQELEEEAARLAKDQGIALTDTVPAPAVAPIADPIVSGGDYKSIEADEETIQDTFILEGMGEEERIDVTQETRADEVNFAEETRVLNNVEVINR